MIQDKELREIYDELDQPLRAICAGRPPTNVVVTLLSAGVAMARRLDDLQQRIDKLERNAYRMTGEVRA